MSKFHVNALTGAILAVLLVSFAFDQARAAPPDAATPEQAAPQGEDSLGTDGDAQTPPAEHNGVIKPPPTGDEDIHTDVPDPNAGSGQDIIRPSELPGAEGAEPK